MLASLARRLRSRRRISRGTDEVTFGTISRLRLGTERQYGFYVISVFVLILTVIARADCSIGRRLCNSSRAFV